MISFSWIWWFSNGFGFGLRLRLGRGLELILGLRRIVDQSVGLNRCYLEVD